MLGAKMATACSLLSKDQLAPPASTPARFRLQKPEAAKIGTWTHQRLLNPQIVFLLFPAQTRKGSGWSMCTGWAVRGVVLGLQA